MDTVPIRSVLDGISALLGAEPVDAGSPEHVSFIANLNRHFARGWKHDFWPEWTPVELRGYRPAWDSAASYAIGAEVLFGGKYWTATAVAGPDDVPGEESAITDDVDAITDETGEAITDGTSVWAELTAYARYVAFEQPGLTPIGTVKRVCRRDPRVYPERPAQIHFDITHEGIVPGARAGAEVYVEFRLRAPKFTAKVWKSTTNYALGALVYDDASGECYKALQAGMNQTVTTPAYWLKIDFPAILQSFVEHACYGDALRGDGQTGKALAEQGNAEQFLILACDDAFAGQSQYSTASYSTR